MSSCLRRPPAANHDIHKNKYPVQVLSLFHNKSLFRNQSLACCTEITLTKYLVVSSCCLSLPLKKDRKLEKL